MSAITTCPKCGLCYEEQSEEEANAASRSCLACWRETKEDTAAWVRHELERAERQGSLVDEITGGAALALLTAGGVIALHLQ